MFSLDYQLAVSDVLFYEELEELHGHLLREGLEAKSSMRRWLPVWLNWRCSTQGPVETTCSRLYWPPKKSARC